MTDSTAPKQSVNPWKKLKSPKRSICEVPASWWNTYSQMCSYYVDIDGKEWIIILLPSQPRAFECDSYLYDVEKDEIKPFIKDYVQGINNKFMIYHVERNNSSTANTLSYVIDNHTLYWLHTTSSQNSLISLDIKDLQNIELISHTLLPSSIDNIGFTKNEYKMMVVGNTIQFILGVVNNFKTSRKDAMINSRQHFEFNIKTKKLSLIHKNIHDKWNNHIPKLKMDDLKIGDYIDVKDIMGDWYLSKILDIKDKVYYNYNYNSNSDDDDNCDKHVKAMKILVHYFNWDSKYDEWIDVTNDHNSIGIAHLSNINIFDELRRNADLYNEQSNRKNINLSKERIESIIDMMKISSSICDCIEQCCYSDDMGPIRMLGMNKKLCQYHRIALPKTQSLYTKSLLYCSGLHSKKNNTMIICGRNSINNRFQFDGMYCKRVNINNYDEKDFELIVDGFLRPFKKELFLNIPKELCQMILKYCFIPNDKHWKHMTETDINGELVESIHEKALHILSGYCLVDCNIDCNDRDTSMHIYIFGGKKKFNWQQSPSIKRLRVDIKAQSYKIEQLYGIKCPETDNDYWHVVFCQKSQTIHLFEQKFNKHFSIQLESLNKHLRSL